jgi:ech hydrogenase subunit F
MGLFEMAKTVTKSIIHGPATLMYPVKSAKKTPISRGHVTIDVSKCISCRLCMKKCPAQAICVEPKAKTWEIDRLRCVVCNSCVEVCPVKCLFMDNQYFPAMEQHSGRELFQITYVKPQRPEASPGTGDIPPENP